MIDRWHDADAQDLIGSPAEREAVFDHLLAATLRRQACAPIKSRAYKQDPAADMARFREQLIGARTPADCWYALRLLSNTRHDRHLKVEPIDGGLPVPTKVITRTIANYADASLCDAPRVPIRLATDFGGASPVVFLVGWADDITPSPGITEGAELISINGIPFDEYVRAIEPYHCHSTPAFFWYHLPTHIVRRGSELPDALHADRLTLGFATQHGEVGWTLDFAAPSSVILPDHDPRYSGWQVVLEQPSYRLLCHPDKRVLTLDWRAFGATLVADVDILMRLCVDQKLLSHALIFDATRSRGGDYGGYLLQRLAHRPFRINFGDLRLSDAIPDVIANVLAEDAEALARGDSTADQIAAMSWRRDWLLGAVMQDYSQGLNVTPPVPFKCAHQPASGDGWLRPAEHHFCGPLVCLTMPFGGSHIDQVVAQLRDNDLCHQIGMPLGGYSKTWVGTEVIRLADGRPIARFGWSCGNTLRPNGEVLEGNPAIPHETLAPTRKNHSDHHARLVKAALDWIHRSENLSSHKDTNGR